MNNPVPANRYWCFGIVVTVALLWDLISKSWVFSTLGFPYHVSEWSWSMNKFLWGKLHIQFSTSFNEGALWGVGQGYSGLFAGLSVVAATVVVYWLFARGEARSWWMTVCLALIMAGTLGNLFDRLYLHGCQLPDGTPIHGVRDFLDFRIPFVSVHLSPFSVKLIEEYPWPIFNFADTYLVTGAIMLTLHSFRAGGEATKEQVAQPEKATVAA